ncbi:MAG: aminodeoxychorismate synthase component I, partial [Victivallales bacterium]|nr:aminodeoxychorismate synthase component I [Victivallales bacterium]
MSCDSSEGVVVCRLPGADNKAPVWVRFSQPVEIVEAHSVDAVLPALEKISSATAAGLYAAGLISYEAAPTFDEANVTIPPNDAPPLLWFALYETPNEYWESASFAPRNPRKQKTEIATRDVDDFVAEFSRDDYLKSVETLLAYIREGDIYQANLTFRRISTNREATPFDLFLELMRAHPVPYGAFIDAGQFQIVSISPELFLLKTGNRLKTIPMKGTAARSPIPAKDAEIAAGLSLDEKNRAENLMILDMARNDLGRICLPGTIKANNLFQVETYASLHQMVSEVTGTLPDSTSLTDILQATFPAASITGAPKIRAMELIRELEKSPRGVYTGAIGCFEPNGDFLLNVAIRTITFSRSTMELGVGGGIVSDSSPEDEWNECLLKSHFITKRRVDFDLLETMLWKHHADHDPASAPLKNVEFLNEHLTRMRASADYFEFTFDETAISAKLAESIAEIP